MSVSSLLETIGETYDVNLGSFWNQKRTMASMLTLAGVRRLGIDLSRVFRGCGGEEGFDQKEENIDRQGRLVGLDFYQQTALLRAICRQVPVIADRIGFYNLRGSRKVSEVLKKADEDWCGGFFTGEKEIIGKKEGVYPKEGLVIASEIGRIEGRRFCFRNIRNGGWNDDGPMYSNYGGVMVVGGFI